MSRFEGLLSAEYDHVPLVVPAYFELEASLARRIKDHLSGPRIIEIGAGTGYTTQAIASEVPGASITAIDDEMSMLDQARVRLGDYIDSRSVTLVHADALAFLKQQTAGSCDIVASAFTLHNVLDAYRAELEVEIARVLTNGGLFVNLDKYAVENREEYLRELTDQVLRYDRLLELSGPELRRSWVRHELEDQLPERIMWSGPAIGRLLRVGLCDATVVERVGQYAIVVAYRR